MFSGVRSIPDVVDVLELGGGDGPALVIEVPHGATGDWEFNVVASQLRGAVPDDLIAFFHVNTDNWYTFITSSSRSCFHWGMSKDWFF